MKPTFVFSSVVTLLVMTSSTAFAQRSQPEQGFFPAAVRKAVPGIDAVIVLSDEQKAKIAAARAKVFDGEEIKNARKTARDKSATRQEKRAAAKVVAQAQAALLKETREILGKEQGELIQKIRTAVKETSAKVRGDYKEKLKAARGNRKERRKLQRELSEKLAPLLAETIKGLLTDEQKAAVENAAAKQTETPRKRGKKNKKDGEKKRDKEDKDKKDEPTDV